jgi:hypothetical protein
MLCAFAVEKWYYINYGSSSMAIWQMRRGNTKGDSSAQACAVSRLSGLGHKPQFKVGSLSKWPGFLLPVSRNLGRRDWPIAGQPSRGNATLCLACGKGRNLRLRIYCQSLGRTPGCVLNFRFNQGKQGGLQWTAAWWNPQNQQQTNSWSGPGDGVDRDARSNEMADRAHSRPVESSFKS